MFCKKIIRHPQNMQYSLGVKAALELFLDLIDTVSSQQMQRVYFVTAAARAVQQKAKHAIWNCKHSHLSATTRQLSRIHARNYVARNTMSVYVAKGRTSKWVTAAYATLLGLLVVPPIVVFFAFEDPVLLTGRRRAIVITREAEISMGQQVLASTTNYPTVAHKDPRAWAVRSVGLRIAVAVEEILREEERKAHGELLQTVPTDLSSKIPFGILWLDRLLGRQTDFQWDWKYLVIQSPDINAFCVPGGTVVVCTGLLDFIDQQVREGNIEARETALATVMAHEIGHAVARHGAERLTTAPIEMLARALQDSSPLFPYLFSLLWGLPYSRAMETEADEIGLMLMSRACYDTSHAASFYSSMQSTAPWRHYLSTHPSDSSRAENAAASSAKLALRQRAYCAHLHKDDRVETALSSPAV
jgi:Zn-dependent protease with chaperone function